MTDEYNPYLKSPEELDFDLEANSRAFNIEIGNNRPKGNLIPDGEIENSLEKNRNANVLIHRINTFRTSPFKLLTCLTVLTWTYGWNIL